VIGILIIVGITNPYLILPTLIIVFIFFKIRNVYKTISQSIKRLEGVSKQKKKIITLTYFHETSNLYN